jgi:hypothetical protein
MFTMSWSLCCPHSARAMPSRSWSILVVLAVLCFSKTSSGPESRKEAGLLLSFRVIISSVVPMAMSLLLSEKSGYSGVPSFWSGGGINISSGPSLLYSVSLFTTFVKLWSDHFGVPVHCRDCRYVGIWDEMFGLAHTPGLSHPGI